jgi:hypothetical protein
MNLKEMLITAWQRYKILTIGIAVLVILLIFFFCLYSCGTGVQENRISAGTDPVTTPAERTLVSEGSPLDLTDTITRLSR